MAYASWCQNSSEILLGIFGERQFLFFTGCEIEDKQKVSHCSHFAIMKNLGTD